MQLRKIQAYGESIGMRIYKAPVAGSEQQCCVDYWDGDGDNAELHCLEVAADAAAEMAEKRWGRTVPRFLMR